MEPEIEGWAKVQGKVCNCNRTKTCKRYLIWLRKANKVHYATACYCYSALLHHSVKHLAVQRGRHMSDMDGQGTAAFITYLTHRAPWVVNICLCGSSEIEML